MVSQHEALKERRSFQITGTSAIASVGTTNTNVVAFNVAPVLKWGTLYPVATVSQLPAAGSGVWCNVVNDAVFGTTFKMTRRGIYEFHAILPMTGDEVLTPAANFALTLDSPAANLLAAGTIAPTTGVSPGGVIDLWTGAAAVANCAKVGGAVTITDAMAGAAVPAAAAGAQGVGVVRLHLNDNAGGVYTGVIVAPISLWCNALNDLAG